MRSAGLTTARSIEPTSSWIRWPILGASCTPRGPSGRERSGTPGGQSDLACRTTSSRLRPHPSRVLDSGGLVRAVRATTPATGEHLGTRVARARRLMAIGGAEDKLGSARILRRFVAEAGGSRARGSSCAPPPRRWARRSSSCTTPCSGGSGRPTSSPPARAVAARPTRQRFSDSVARATGVFFTGGNQMKLSATIRGTRFGDAVVAAYQRGVVVGGTSAGASVVSEHMVGLRRLAGRTRSSGWSPRRRAWGCSRA